MLDAQRKHPPKKGAVVTFKYQEVSEDGIPRFPVLILRNSHFSIHKSNSNLRNSHSFFNSQIGFKFAKFSIVNSQIEFKFVKFSFFNSQMESQLEKFSQKKRFSFG